MIRNGLDDATSIQQLLAALLDNLVEGNSKMMRSQESAVTTVSKRVDNELGAVMSTLAAIAISSDSLQQDLVSTTFPFPRGPLNVGR
jgi:hypothetical protein